MSSKVFKMRAMVELALEHFKGEKKSQHVATKVLLDVDPILDKSHYLDDDNLPTKEGSKALTVCLVNGLTTNIHAAHQKGFWDSAEHLRYIIAELEKGFVVVARVEKSTMSSKIETEYIETEL